MRQFFKSRFRVFIIVGAVVVLLSIGAAFYFYAQYQKLTQPNADVTSITDQISKYYDLPAETPSLTSVTDKSKLVQQSFFARAENGDKVLIFSSSGKAILYRPSSGKIVNIAPVQAAAAIQPPTKAPASASPSSKLKK